MELRAFGIAVASVVALFWAASGTQRERALLTGATGATGSAASGPDVVRDREAAVAARPDDPAATRALAQAYLDAQQPGLALALLEAAPESLRNGASDARSRHVYARALLDQGRN